MFWFLSVIFSSLFIDLAHCVKYMIDCVCIASFSFYKFVFVQSRMISLLSCAILLCSSWRLRNLKNYFIGIFKPMLKYLEITIFSRGTTRSDWRSISFYEWIENFFIFIWIILCVTENGVHFVVIIWWAWSFTWLEVLHWNV